MIYYIYVFLQILKEMLRKYKLYSYTFLSVSLTVFIIGYIGVSHSLNVVQKRYINLQLEVNRQYAQSMARFLEAELATGTPPEVIRQRFQSGLEGTETEKSFLCMFNNKGVELCHPDTSKIGQIIDDDNSTVLKLGDEQNSFREMLLSGTETGGLRQIKHNNRSEVVYLAPVAGTDWLVASHENTAEVIKYIQNFRKTLIVGFIILGLLIAIVATFLARMISRKHEQKIEYQKKQIEQQRDEIEKKNSEITSSINYASRIQTALHPEPKLPDFIKEHFVFWKPRDIVSGDFYWIRQVGNKIVFVAADSTGHGIPGAFMSMLGVSFFNDIVWRRKILKPADVLNELRQQVKDALHQTGNKGEQKDGMDIAICVFDIETRSLEYAGAHNPLYLFRNETIQDYKADRMPVGIYIRETPFTYQQVQLEKNDMLYIFTDGYVDQFGGKNNEKLKSKRFKDLLSSISLLPVEKQKQQIDDFLQTWQGNNEQIDDILIIGIRV